MNQTKSSSIEQLTPALLQYCFRFLHRREQLVCSTVSGTFRKLALPLLEECVSLVDEQQVESWLEYVALWHFAKPVVPVKKLRLGRMGVRLLRYDWCEVLRSVTGLKVLRMYDVRLSSMEDIFVERLSSLEELLLSGVSVRSLTKVPLTFNLERLIISTCCDTEIVDWQVLVQTAPRWLELEYLSGCYDYHFTAAFSQFSPGVSLTDQLLYKFDRANLTHLAIRQGMSAPTLALVGSALEDFSSLVSMEADDCDLETLFARNDSNVQSLWFYVYNKGSTDQQVMAFTSRLLDFRGMRYLKQLSVCPPRNDKVPCPPLLSADEVPTLELEKTYWVEVSRLRSKCLNDGGNPIVLWYGNMEITSKTASNKEPQSLLSDSDEESLSESSFQVVSVRKSRLAVYPTNSNFYWRVPSKDFEYNLPDDIVFLIFDELSKNLDREKRDIFYRLSLVCKQWLHCARASFVNRHDLQRASQIHAVLQPGFPIYHLTHLSITFEITEDGIEMRDAFDNLHQLISSIPSLQSLHLLSGIREPHELFPILAKKPSFHSLSLRCKETIVYRKGVPTSCRLPRVGPRKDERYEVTTISMTSRRLLNLVATLPLRHLEIIDLKDDGGSLPLAFAKPTNYLPQLRSLRLIECLVSPILINDLTLPSSTTHSHLHTLVISLSNSGEESSAHQLTPASLLESLHPHSSTLEHLSIEVPSDGLIVRDPFNDPGFLLKVAPGLPLLRYLRLSSPPMFDLDGLGVLPPTLRILELEGQVSHCSPLWIGELLNAGRLPHLVAIRCETFSRSGWRLSDLAAARAISARPKILWEIRVGGVWAELRHATV